MTTDHTIPRLSYYDKFSFFARSWLNWAVIQRGIIQIHLRRWPATWLLDVLATVLVTLLLVPAWALYRLGALVGKLSRRRDNITNVKNDNSYIPPEPYAVLPVGATLVLEVRTEPPALVIRRDGAAVEVEPGELMALAGALTVAAGGLPELMASKGILWKR